MGMKDGATLIHRPQPRRIKDQEPPHGCHSKGWPGATECHERSPMVAKGRKMGVNTGFKRRILSRNWQNLRAGENIPSACSVG